MTINSQCIRQADQQKSLFLKPASLIILVLGCLFIASTFVVFGALCYPGLHPDADLFAPVTFNVASGKGWISQGYVVALTRDSGDHYDDHGILMPLIIGGLLGARTPERLFLMMGFGNALIAILYVGIGFVRARKITASAVVTSLLLGVCGGIIGLALQGRPEQLGLLVAPMSLWIRGQQRQGKPALAASSIFVAVLAGISPILGFYGWLFLAFLLGLLPHQKAWLYSRRLIVMSSAALALLALMIKVFTPYSLLILVERMLRYSKTPFIQGYQLLDIGNLQTQALLWQVPILAALVVAAGICIRRRLIIPASLLALPFLALARLSGSYLYLPFVPTCWLLLEEHSRMLTSPLRPLSRTILSSLLIIYLFIGCRYLSLEYLYLKGDASFADIQRRAYAVQVQARREGVKVGYVTARFPSLSILALPGDELIAVHGFGLDWLRDYYEKTHQQKVGYLFIVQEGHSPNQPPSRLDNDRFEIIENRWTSSKARLAGLKLGGFEPGYRYALYKRVH